MGQGWLGVGCAGPHWGLGSKGRVWGLPRPRACSQGVSARLVAGSAPRDGLQGRRHAGSPSARGGFAFLGEKVTAAIGGPFGGPQASICSRCLRPVLQSPLGTPKEPGHAPHAAPALSTAPLGPGGAVGANAGNCACLLKSHNQAIAE